MISWGVSAAYKNQDMTISSDSVKFLMKEAPLSIAQKFVDKATASDVATGAAVLTGFLAAAMAFFGSRNRNHDPIMYGRPGDGKDGPAVPEGQTGEFNPSFDNELWLFSRRWEPPTGVQCIATLTILHGTVDHSGQYDELGKFLARHGVAVFAQDMRGWGLSDGDRLYYSDKETFVQDVASFYAMCHSRIKYSSVKPRFLLGKSIGGLIAKQAMERHPDFWPGGLVAMSASFGAGPGIKKSPILQVIVKCINLVSPKTRLKKILEPWMIVSDSAALALWEEDALCSKEKVPAAYIVNALDGIAECEKSKDPLFSGAHCLCLWGTGDKVVSKEGHEHVLSLCSGVDSGESRLITYEGGFHNLLLGNRSPIHEAFLTITRLSTEPQHKDKVMDDIVAFIQAEARSLSRRVSATASNSNY